MSASDQIVAFLAGELSRRDDQQCVGFDLVHFHDENVRSWSYSEHPQMFEVANCKTNVSLILAAASDYIAERPSEEDRFMVRTKQFLGGRRIVTFHLGDDNQ